MAKSELSINKKAVRLMAQLIAVAQKDFVKLVFVSFGISSNESCGKKMMPIS